MDSECIDRLREDLTAAGYRLSAIRELIGEESDAARVRGVFAPARRSLAERSADPLATLTCLFLLGDIVEEDSLATALPRLGITGAHTLGLVTFVSGGLRAAISLNPVEIADPRVPVPSHWWILSDLDDALRLGSARPDHVMGVGGATRTLIAQAPPADVRRSLEIGTGCGVVALHLALRGPVVATDISARALRFARANARLNGVTGIEFRQGDLFAPVAGEEFDLILSNPPFVVTPRESDAQRYEYRDAGLVGDELAERVVRRAPEHLCHGGTLLCLANWESPWGQDGLNRVTEWISEADRALGSGSRIAGWVIERDRISPVRYAETWARDGGVRPGDPEFERMMTSWLDDFSERRVVALGLGSIRLRKISAGDDSSLPSPAAPLVHVERAAGAFSEAAGEHLAATFDMALTAVHLSDAEVLAERWVRSPGVVEHRQHVPGEEAPYAIALEGSAGISRRVTADPLLAAAVGACDGELSLGQIADALATLLEVDAGAAAEALVAGVRELVWMGMLGLGTAPRAVD
ncbi:class I SAM-dependent methyltransferase [Leucobacter sp. Z1108]|uniref:class I SAM-dependent methyltransferase n=1 Tax=Leucobacter sp. Z1108 TaxID=3439066 RepID=UPI003F36EF6B